MRTPVAMVIGKFDSRLIEGAVHGFILAAASVSAGLWLVGILANQNAIIKRKVLSENRAETQRYCKGILSLQRLCEDRLTPECCRGFYGDSGVRWPTIQS